MAVGHHIAGTYLSSDLRLNSFSTVEQSVRIAGWQSSSNRVSSVRQTDQACRIEVDEFMIVKRRINAQDQLLLERE